MYSEAKRCRSPRAFCELRSYWHTRVGWSQRPTGDLSRRPGRRCQTAFPNILADPGPRPRCFPKYCWDSGGVQHTAKLVSCPQVRVPSMRIPKVLSMYCYLQRIRLSGSICFKPRTRARVCITPRPELRGALFAGAGRNRTSSLYSERKNPFVRAAA